MAASNPMTPDSAGKKKARIEIIPLIDVIFFLCATFVLFTLSLEKLKSLPIQLPVAQTTAIRQQQDDMVTLQVSDQGTCYWNHELINLSEVAPRLEHYKSQTANPRVLVTSDDRAKYGVVIKVFDEVRKAGIDQVSIETRTRATGR